MDLLIEICTITLQLKPSFLNFPLTQHTRSKLTLFTDYILFYGTEVWIHQTVHKYTVSKKSGSKCEYVEQKKKKERNK